MSCYGSLTLTPIQLSPLLVSTAQPPVTTPKVVVDSAEALVISLTAAELVRGRPTMQRSTPNELRPPGGPLRLRLVWVKEEFKKENKKPRGLLHVLLSKDS